MILLSHQVINTSHRTKEKITMANKISITLDYSGKFLDKQRDIANNDGII